MTLPNPDVIAGLVKEARPLILEHFSRRSCIASTRIGIDVLQYFGISAVPMPLFFAVFNSEWMDMLDAGATMEEVTEAAKRHTAADTGGPWSLGVGSSTEDSDEGDWAGHLMIGLPQIEMILDLSVDQASRPHKGIVFTEPLILRIPDRDWWTGDETRWAVSVRNEEGVRLGLVFSHELDDRDGYKRSPNWRRTSTKDPAGTRATYKEITGRIIRSIKEGVAA